ncbi:Non-motile and phage-resistance protein [Thiorhodovibrio winogradskyi]|uniref:histidine kinase n=1 Tax=Thiorhodovibrio winogradskyi TaxID=77007 RepID=A0ABZ0SBD9_9GAMM|nr:ATP-binding protein [Thiorhodovibrio winogradskyi]
MPTVDSPDAQEPIGRAAPRGLTIPLLACIGLVIVSGILASWRMGVRETQLHEKVLTEALGLAQTLALYPFDTTLLANPSASSDQEQQTSTQLSCHLHRFAAFAGYSAIWTLSQQGENFQFGPGSNNPGRDCRPRLDGQRPSIPPETAQVFTSGQAVISAPHGRDGAPVISVLVPLDPVPRDQNADYVLGIDIAASHWRAAIWSAAILPLALGGVLTLAFIIAAGVVYHSGAASEQTSASLRYLEPVLAALTGLALTLAATAIANQLERDSKSDLLEWTSSRFSLDMARILRAQQATSNQDSAAPPPSFATDQLMPASGLASAEVPAVIAARHLLEQSLLQQHRFELKIDADLLALNDQGTARLIRPVSDTHQQNQTAKVRFIPPLSATTNLQELLPLFTEGETFAIQLKIGTTSALQASAARATGAIGLILTAVATALVVWLRGRLASLERLLNQRNDALQQREANFSAITNSVRDAIIMMDNRSRITYWNPAAEQLFGHSETEAKGQDLHRLLGGPELAKTYHSGSSDKSALSGDPLVGRLVEVEAKHKNGKRVPLELSLSTMLLDRKWHAIGVLRDITARKRSQERLVKLNNCLANLGSDYRENIDRITSVAGKILTADTALYNRLDNGLLVTLGSWQAPEDLPPKDAPEGHICYDLIKGSANRDSGRCGGSLTDAISSQDAFFLDDLTLTDYPRTDPAVRNYALKAYFGHVVRCGGEAVGSLCVVFKHQRTPSDEEKRLLGILAAALTTEENRHLATLELELSEKRMSLAMRSTGIGIWEYEPDTRQLRADTSMHGLLGLQAVLATRSIDDWVLRLLPEDMPKLKQTLQTSLTQEGELDEELRLPITESEVRYLRIIGSVHAKGHDDRPYVIGVCYNITRRKETESRLRQAKDIAEKASQMKTRFLSQVSHELRTPMNAVLGFAQLLDSDPDLNEDQQDSVQEILRSGHHLLKLIDEVLDLAQIESGETEIHIQELVLAPALEESLTLIRQLAREHELSIHFSSPEDLAVAADSFRLKQILINLLSNAIKYNRPGGSIWLAAEALPEDLVRISVRDTGAGIRADQLGDLFEPFQRLPDAQLSGVEGSGIGLAVVKRLVELMGGNIGVESVPGEGSCFWFDLPRRPTDLAVVPLLRPEPAHPLVIK